MARASAHSPTDFVRRLSAALVDDGRIEGLWLEGDDDSIQWPPYARIDLHFAIAEPNLQAVRLQMHAVLEHAGPVRDFSQQDAPLQGYAGTAKLSDGKLPRD